METLYPLCFNETLLESQIQQYECSDSIYVSNNRFSLFMTDGDEALIVLSIKCGTRTVFSTIRGTHTGADDIVYAPSWICQLLGADCGDTVELEQVHPNLGSTITIKPHTSQYSLLEDPVSELRNAFENYSCLCSGVDIPLLVAGQVVVVSILETHSSAPICIRGVELEVKIETPLDKEAEEAAAVAEAAAKAEAAEAEARASSNTFDDGPTNICDDFLIPIVSSSSKFPGRGYRLDGKNSH